MEPAHVERVAPVLGGCFLVFVALVILIMAAVMVWVFCRIFSKAGYSWALGLLMLVPVANIVMPFVLAFADWPVLKELRLLRQPPSAAGPPPQ